MYIVSYNFPGVRPPFLFIEMCLFVQASKRRRENYDGLTPRSQLVSFIIFPSKKKKTGPTRFAPRRVLMFWLIAVTDIVNVGNWGIATGTAHRQIFGFTIRFLDASH